MLRSLIHVMNRIYVNSLVFRYPVAPTSVVENNIVYPLLFLETLVDFSLVV